MLVLVRLALIEDIGEPHHEHRRRSGGKKRPDQVQAELFDVNVGPRRPRLTPARDEKRQQYPQHHGGDGGHLKANKRGHHERGGQHQRKTAHRFQPANAGEQVPAIPPGTGSAHHGLQGIKKHPGGDSAHRPRGAERNLLRRPQGGGAHNQRPGERTERASNIHHTHPVHAITPRRTNCARHLRLNTRNNAGDHKQRRPEQQKLLQLFAP